MRLANLVNRPAVLAGLFLLLICNSSSATYLSGKLYGYIFPNYRDSYLETDSSSIAINSLFNTVIHTENLKIYSHQIETRATLSKKNWGAKLFVRNHRFDLEASKINSEQGKKSFSTNSLVTELTVSPWFKTKDLTIGFDIGKTFSPEYYRNHQNFTIEQPFTYLLGNREIVLGAFVDINFNIFDFHFTTSRRAVSAQTPKYEIVSSGKNRKFPLSLIQNRVDADLGVNISAGRVFIKYDRLHLYSDSLTTAIDALPFVSSWHLNNFIAGGAVRKFLFEFSYGFGGGYLNGYDSDADNASRYFIFEDLNIKKVFSNFGYKINKNIEASIYFEYFLSTLPGRAYVDLYPFSSWTIFKSEGYRFSDGEFRYINTGLSLSGKKKWNHITESCFELAPSYLKIKSHVEKETQKIIVFFPIYTDEKHLNLIDDSHALIDIKLSQKFYLSNFRVNIGAEQIILIPSSKKFGLNTIFLDLSYRF